jgi:hypothetical protein
VAELASLSIVPPLIYVDYPKGQLSGIATTPENKTASLTTRTVSSKPKRTLAIHGSAAGFSDRMFIFEEPAFGLLVRSNVNSFQKFALRLSRSGSFTLARLS